MGLPLGREGRPVRRLDRILVIEQSLIRRQWSLTCKTPLCPLLCLTGVLNLHLQQVPKPYLLDARRRWLRINYVERIGIWPVLRTWNWQQLGNLRSVRLYRSRIPVSTTANGFPSRFIPNTSWTPWWVCGAQGQRKIYSIYGVFK